MRRPLCFRLKPLAVGLLLLAGTGGCGFFETRDATAPDAGNETWIPPTQAFIVVDNLERSFEAGVFTDYGRSLTETFVFVPDKTDVAALETQRPGEAVYEDWDADAETETAQEIASDVNSVELDLEFLEPEELLPEGRLRKYNYSLRLVREDTTEEFVGQAWFTIVQQPGGDWLIDHWEDVKTDATLPTWGLLKGQSRVL